MSPKANRNTRQVQLNTPDLLSSLPFQGDDIPTSSHKCLKKARKIRRTQDLVCLPINESSLCVDNNLVQIKEHKKNKMSVTPPTPTTTASTNKLQQKRISKHKLNHLDLSNSGELAVNDQKHSQKDGKRPVEIADNLAIDNYSMEVKIKDINSSKSRKSSKLDLTEKIDNSPQTRKEHNWSEIGAYEEQDTPDKRLEEATVEEKVDEVKFEISEEMDLVDKLEQPTIKAEFPERKFVKAKRVFKTKALEQNSAEIVSLNVYNQVVQKSEESSKLQSLHNPLSPGESTHDGSLFFEKKSQDNFFIVESLPSPILSPSGSSDDGSVSFGKKSFHFKSSQENLVPSTSGAVNSSKRRTYELEDSIIDISSLKSLSARDSKRMSSISNIDTVSKTPQSLVSKVTNRRRWNKNVAFSPCTNHESPGWVSNKKSKDCIIVAGSAESKKSSKKNFFSRIQMPDFAAIHQKSQSRLENLSEYKDRKELRAKMLIAGLKPPKSGHKSVTKSAAGPVGTGGSRKNLRFAPETVEAIKSPTFIPLPSTPRPKARPPPSPSPRPKVRPPPSPSPRPVFKFGKENQKEKGFKPPPKEAPGILKPPNVFTFRANNKNDFQKKQQIKSIVTKCKPATNVKEAQRCAIKGVRSNRRFDLLMKMRKNAL